MSTLLVILDDVRECEQIIDERYPTDIDGTILFRDGLRFLSWFKRMYDSRALCLGTTFFSFDNYIYTYRDGIELQGVDIVREMLEYICSNPGNRDFIKHIAHTSDAHAAYKIDMLIYNYNNVIECGRQQPPTNPVIVSTKVIKRGNS